MKENNEYIDKGAAIVAYLWRDGGNIGSCFSRHGREMKWQDMTADERMEVADNMMQMGAFFARFAAQGKEVQDENA